MLRATILRGSAESEEGHLPGMLFLILLLGNDSEWTTIMIVEEEGS